MTAQAVDLSGAGTLITNLGEGVETQVPVIGGAILTVAGLFIVLRAGVRWVRGQAK